MPWYHRRTTIVVVFYTINVLSTTMQHCHEGFIKISVKADMEEEIAFALLLSRVIRGRKKSR
jgi:hypothetical protein